MRKIWVNENVWEMEEGKSDCKKADLSFANMIENTRTESLLFEFYFLLIYAQD